MSAPARICRNLSATEAVRVKRGSTTIILALRLRLASTAHLNPHGWFSAGLPPMINIMSVFLMSIQPLVIAPRPNVGPRVEAVGPCQTRAWFSRLPELPLIFLAALRADDAPERPCGQTRRTQQLSAAAVACYRTGGLENRKLRRATATRAAIVHTRRTLADCCQSSGRQPLPTGLKKGLSKEIAIGSIAPVCQ